MGTVDVRFPIWEINLPPVSGQRARKYHDADELAEQLERFDTETIADSKRRFFLDSRCRRVSFCVNLWHDNMVERLALEAEEAQLGDVEIVRQYFPEAWSEMALDLES